MTWLFPLSCAHVAISPLHDGSFHALGIARAARYSHVFVAQGFLTSASSRHCTMNQMYTSIK
jgi:hypothetical protein